MTVPQQRALFARLGRAMTAYRLNRITGETFDRIIARINRAVNSTNS